jgi:hypothetical protein
MKKFYPYVFPAVALLFVLFLLFRWYNLRTQREGLTSLLSDGVKIENLDPSDASNLLKGASDYKTADLAGEGTDMGEVRYEVKDGKMLFTVSAVLPKLDEGYYQVWLKEVAGEGKRKALVLEYLKGGYVGSASINADTLPFEVLVTKELTSDDSLEEIVLKGMVEEQN